MESHICNRITLKLSCCKTGDNSWCTTDHNCKQFWNYFYCSFSIFYSLFFLGKGTQLFGKSFNARPKLQISNFCKSQCLVQSKGIQRSGEIFDGLYWPVCQQPYAYHTCKFLFKIEEFSKGCRALHHSTEVL